MVVAAFHGYEAQKTNDYTVTAYRILHIQGATAPLRGDGI